MSIRSETTAPARVPDTSEPSDYTTIETAPGLRTGESTFPWHYGATAAGENLIEAMDATVHARLDARGIPVPVADDVETVNVLRPVPAQDLESDSEATVIVARPFGACVVPFDDEATVILSRPVAPPVVVHDPDATVIRQLALAPSVAPSIQPFPAGGRGGREQAVASWEQGAARCDRRFAEPPVLPTADVPAAHRSWLTRVLVRRVAVVVTFGVLLWVVLYPRSGNAADKAGIVSVTPAPAVVPLRTALSIRRARSGHDTGRAAAHIVRGQYAQAFSMYNELAADAPDGRVYQALIDILTQELTNQCRSRPTSSFCAAR